MSLCTCTLCKTACLLCWCFKTLLAIGRCASTPSLRVSRGWCEKRRAQNCKDTLRDILHWHYVHIPGENILYIITYWSFSREKINIHPTNWGICTQHRIKFFFYLFSYVSPHELPELTTPLSLPISSPFLCWTLPIFQRDLPKIHSIALTSAAAFRLRTRPVSILRACVTSVSFVLRLFVKKQGTLHFIYPPWDFFFITTTKLQ
jgi:hypothetical protein